jgi:hypothetical protein
VSPSQFALWLRAHGASPAAALHVAALGASRSSGVSQ